METGLSVQTDHLNMQCMYSIFLRPDKVQPRVLLLHITRILVQSSETKEFLHLQENFHLNWHSISKSTVELNRLHLNNNAF